MKKIVAIILGILWIVVFVGTVLGYTVPAVNDLLSSFLVYLLLAAIILSSIWIVIFFISIYHREVGKLVETEDDEFQYDLREAEEDDDNEAFYSDIEKAEFAERRREDYKKKTYAYPDGYEKPEVIEEIEEVKPEKPAPLPRPKKEPEVEIVAASEPEINLDELKEEEPIEEEPIIEEVPVLEKTPVEAEPEVLPVVSDEPKALIPLSRKELVNFTLWEGNEVKVSEGWIDYLNNESQKTYFQDMIRFVSGVYKANKLCYPAANEILKCLEYTDFDNVRVVILGKIPFYRKNQCDGLAFSTGRDQAPNQTTKVIINEAVSDVGIKPVTHGSLVSWAKHGVLLMNSVMTAPADKPASHTDCGWLTFTDGILDKLIKDNRPKVFILWGEHARGYAEKVATNPKHLIIEAPNPSPLSAANGFYGSKPFSKVDEFLVANGYEPIDWEL